MSSLEVGQELVKYCREGRNIEAVEKLYAANIVSIEPIDGPMPARQEGVEAIRNKNQWWVDNHEIHSASCEGPFPHGDRFTVHFAFDVTFKPENRRMQMAETALYTVKDNKIVQEEFFYQMG